MPTKLNFEYGEYDDKKDVYKKWDPATPRSTRNFNPFETFKGNSPDASGIYPGEVSDISDVTMDPHHVILVLYFIDTFAHPIFFFILLLSGPLQGRLGWRCFFPHHDGREG
jgi:hypothetical protein